MTISEPKLTRAELTPWTNPPLKSVPITGSRYTSTAFMEREWQHIWTRTWLLLGRTSEIPMPGDYQMEDLGPESFIMMRQDDGSIRAFYNVCQHRGSRMIYAHEGSSTTSSVPTTRGSGAATECSRLCETSRTIPVATRAGSCRWPMRPSSTSSRR